MPFLRNLQRFMVHAPEKLVSIRYDVHMQSGSRSSSRRSPDWPGVGSVAEVRNAWELDPTALPSSAFPNASVVIFVGDPAQARFRQSARRAPVVRSG
jgi:hypothetical protein